ncbi:DHH family phosphohydrolase-like protein [Moumouvirus goulette]|uniref:DHH family phosphohydrolase-like protein n=1 Tax=Moumouvirus goulette TaxID=1247379 RepID=M1PAK5_9VIRU|nr:DHH family phosphohydrolase-like protein [Moumouvirus goulette]AGF84884.1 DHH family phosphohydrolase-like protein [Moumouvirus goulette]
MDTSTINKDFFKNKVLEKDKIDVVFYHGYCSDGFGSAFVIWYYYKMNYGQTAADNITYIPCYHQKDLQTFSPDFLQKINNKNVIMCDFSYKYNQLLDIITLSKSFMILDHHKTAQAELINIPEHLKVFDMSRSGAGITWDFFFPDKPIPKFLAHIQDRDIWTFKLPKTNEFIAFFYEQDFNFTLWEKYLLEENVTEAIITGEKWLEYQKITINKIIKRTSYIIQNINNQYTIVLYANSPEFKSDIGNKLFYFYPFGDFSCVWDYSLYKDETYYSLRSTNDRYDVSTIAKVFGGGGHRNASGLAFSGIKGCLPYEKINDYGLVELFTQNNKGVDIYNESFVLFKVKEIINEWFGQKYVDLIKRKCNYTWFIFETDKQYTVIHRDNFDLSNSVIYNLEEFNKNFKLNN